ncbi:MAG: MFS transporter, partial [Candidatus Thorarchaeota archaeon]
MSGLLFGVRELNPRAKRFISKATSLMLVYVFAIMLTNTFLILHALDFVSLSELAVILAVQFAVQALADYPSGAIGDMIGQRWVLFIAALSFGTGFILLSQAYDFLSILIAFIMIAFAQSQESGAFMSWFDNNYKLYAVEDVDRRTYSQFYGRFTMFYGLVTAASFTLGGALMIFISRQFMFIIQGALVVLVSIMFLFFMRDHEALKRERKGFRRLFQFLRAGIASTSQSKTLRLMILGLVISGVGFTIWSGLILFPLYANYAKSDAGTAILRSIIFITGAIGAGLAGVISKRIHKLQRWLSFAVLITDATFFIGIYIMMAFNPVPLDFSLISNILVILTFAIAFSPRYLADVLKPRFYLDVIPDHSRNAVYSLIPTLILIASIPIVPVAGILIEAIGVETMVLILSVNGL